MLASFSGPVTLVDGRMLLEYPLGRKAWLREAMRQLEAEQAEDLASETESGETARSAEFEFDAAQVVSRDQGRKGWPREAKRQLDQHRARNPRPVPRSRPARLRAALAQLEEELDAERQANEAYQACRARGRMKDGRRFGSPPKPYVPPALAPGRIN